MKTKINSLNDALAFILQGLYFTESKLKDEFTLCCNQITSPKINEVITAYAESSENKQLKIERIFNYLLKEPLSRTNEVINELMKETHQMLNATNSSHLKDILSVGCIQNINAYKIAGYRSAYMFAAELELDTVTDLIQQILEWELGTRRLLSELSIEEFNNTQPTSTIDHAWEID
jgi:ferritin-like metal-binding protein YciE